MKVEERNSLLTMMRGLKLRSYGNGFINGFNDGLEAAIDIVERYYEANLPSAEPTTIGNISGLFYKYFSVDNPSIRVTQVTPSPCKD